MPVDEALFQRSLMAAAKLCEPTAEEKMRSVGRQQRGAIAQGLSEGMGMDGGIYDNTQYLAEVPQNTMSQSAMLAEAARAGGDPLAVNKERLKNSKLPPAILAHLQNTEEMNVDPRLLAEAGMSEAMGGKSILSAIVPQSQIRNTAPVPVQEMVSNIHTTPSAGFDYTALKAIINECLDEKIKEYSKQMLNESTLRTIGLKEGKIRLVDNKGNIYSAKLEHSGNVNDKKK